MAAASAVVRTSSTGTIIANNGSMIFNLDSEGVVKYTTELGQSYFFLRLINEKTVLPFYKSSGVHTGMKDIWFPCYGIDNSLHIKKGTPDSVPKLYEPYEPLREESMLYRVSSELGLRGMAAINFMTPKQFETFQKRLIEATSRLADRMSDLLAELADEFQSDSPLKQTIQESVVRDITFPELQRFLSVHRKMDGGHRCAKKKYGWNTRKVARSPFRRLATAKKAEAAWRVGRSIGFTARSSLKAMGRIPRSTGCFELGPKYR